jgi:biotin-(acetyl-CoA carboxylase) ligase
VFSTKVNLSGLSLVVGLALLEVLRDYGAMGLKLKWPNDIYYQYHEANNVIINFMDYKAIADDANTRNKTFMNILSRT